MAELPIPSAPILVVGDIMCDHYIWGDVERISPEAPVQVLRWEREADRPGGAANAALNLAALGCRVRLVGIVGKDEAGRWLRRSLKEAGIDTSGVVESSERTTTLKTRVIARGQHMLRIDRETRGAIAGRDEKHLVSAIRKAKGRVAGVVCSDYGKGVLTDRVLRSLLEGRSKPFVVVDPKSRDFRKYRGAHVLTPNEKELADATQVEGGVSDDAAVRRRAESLMRALGFQALLVTRGANGMDLFERDRRTIRRTHIAASQRHEVFDVTGAGDTVAAVLTMAASGSMPLADAARVANAAAGIVVGLVGTAVAEPEALARMMDGESSQAGAKVLSRNAVAARIREARQLGSTVVFTSGPFESLNVADLRLLQAARARGELLVVGVNGDPATGPQRAEMLAALRFVDYVTLFSDRTPARLIRELRPDIVV
ncbi:MAG: D-glycero-beta-D-manno-heptose-7-phosphate kinase [Acidobacteria bacterium]|nr:MAG: D-glycero-beta-D-manno-heptose-7-phosphate kinase [Acidobacteriota bacterium]